MKLVFIGCVESSLRFVEEIYKNTSAEIVGIVTKTESAFNSDHVSLVDFAKKGGIDWHNFESNDRMENWIKSKSPDLIYCFGWSHILPLSICDIPKYGAVGYHPSLLPENRGRHPIVWALVLGLEKTGSTFFFLSNEADAGDILNQRIVEIKPTDDARILYNRLLEVGKEQVVILTEDFINNTIKPVKQDEMKANVWRKRSKKDGLIDWRMTTDSILRLISALSKPYVGAHAMYKGNEFVIWKAEEVKDLHFLYANIEPGKVIETSNDTFVVKTGNSLIKILEHELDKSPKPGEYL